MVFIYLGLGLSRAFSHGKGTAPRTPPRPRYALGSQKHPRPWARRATAGRYKLHKGHQGDRHRALKALLRGVAALPGCSVAALLLTAILGLLHCHVSRDTGAGDRMRERLWGPPPALVHLLPSRWPQRNSTILKKSKVKIGRNLETRSMSAFGGKADVNQGVVKCPLIATSGHSS